MNLKEHEPTYRKIRRGDIYYVTSGLTEGTEIRASRPAIIVSRDELNDESHVVEVVYLTTHPRADHPGHTKIYATGRESHALCEQVSTVSTMRLGAFVARCSEEEMCAISRAIRYSIGEIDGDAVLNNEEDLRREVLELNAKVAAYREMLMSLCTK